MQAVVSRSLSYTLLDVIALTKPRITAMVLVTAAGGMWLAPHANLQWLATVGTLLTIAMVVASANALNCYLERDTDRLMTRTSNRPLPAGRLQPRVALYFGAIVGIASIPLLASVANTLTASLGLLALVSYVGVYTPMKRITPTALLVGAIPGALPPLMGWTAATGSVDLGGVALFMLLFLWQIPHFVAISLFRQSEYERAGLCVLPLVVGQKQAQVYGLGFGILTLASSLYLWWVGVAGTLYLVAALLLGAMFLGALVRGIFQTPVEPWARRVFVASLIYLTGLFGVLGIDALL